MRSRSRAAPDSLSRERPLRTGEGQGGGDSRTATKLSAAVARRDAPTVAVDVVIFTVTGDSLATLLVQVKKGPCAGQWAFPGGLVPLGESLDDAAARELREKTGIRDVYLEQLYTFGDPARDPHDHVVAVTYFALVPAIRPAEPALLPVPVTMDSVADGPKYAKVEWRNVERLPRLAYGHNAVAEYALARLRAKLAYSNIAYGLLPEAFTLAELQRVYEVILGRALDRRNFRRKITALGLLKPLGRERRGQHRPAALYAFARRAPMYVEVL